MTDPDDNERASSFTLPVECGYEHCGGALKKLNDGGTSRQRTTLMRCQDCGEDWVIFTQMLVCKETGCGTEVAYQRHRRKGEFIDDKCRVAHNAATEERKSRKGRELVTV